MKYKALRLGRLTSVGFYNYRVEIELYIDKDETLDSVYNEAHAKINEYTNLMILETKEEQKKRREAKKQKELMDSKMTERVDSLKPKKPEGSA